MAYSINQYRKDATANYMSKVTSICNSNKVHLQSSNYNNECFYCSDGFNKEKIYYLYGWIKKENYSQDINIKLCTTKDSNLITNNIEDMQFVKHLYYEQDFNNGWREFHLIFSPLIDGYDSILFELNTNKINETVNIIYQELSIFENIISKSLLQESLIKFGVRSNPGALFCINKEEIYLGKSGIFEIYDEDIQTTFLAPVAPLSLSIEGMARLEELKQEFTNSICALNLESKERNFPFFTIDYMYKLK